MAVRVFGYAAGFVFLAAGTFGFVVTGAEHWVERHPDTFVAWFRVNPTHNLAHLLLGAVLLWAATEPPATARIWIGGVGVAYLVLGVAGFWLTGRPDWNLLAINGADNVLHLVSGAAAVVVALLPERPRRAEPVA